MRDNIAAQPRILIRSRNDDRREYHEGEYDVHADTLTIWNDRKGESPPPSRPLKRTPPHSGESLRSSADEQFAKWWQQLTATATCELTGLGHQEALAVWREAFSRLWEDLEVVHDNAKATADVRSDTAALELAYIIDRFHDGRLSFTVHKVMDYWDTDRYLETAANALRLITATLRDRFSARG